MGRRFRILNLQIPPHLSSLHFGSLITNPSFPTQDYFNPSSIPPHPEPVIQHGELKDFKDVRGSLQQGKLQALLTRLATLSLSHSRGIQETRQSSLVKDYSLDNSTAWFNTIAQIPETRAWLENALSEGKDVYLVVGCKTFLDASLQSTAQTDTGVSGQVCEPHYGFGAAGAVRYARDGDRGYKLPDERVFAVQYRKVRFKFFGKRDMEGGVLEKGNRWEQLTRFKGMGMRDVIEVNLVGEDELEDEDEEVEEDVQKEVSVDGADTYVFCPGEEGVGG